MSRNDQKCPQNDQKLSKMTIFFNFYEILTKNIWILTKFRNKRNFWPPQYSKSCKISFQKWRLGYLPENGNFYFSSKFYAEILRKCVGEEIQNFVFLNSFYYTGGTVRTKKLSLKSLALNGPFGAKYSLPQKIFHKNNQIVRI